MCRSLSTSNRVNRGKNCSLAAFVDSQFQYCRHAGCSGFDWRGFEGHRAQAAQAVGHSAIGVDVLKLKFGLSRKKLGFGDVAASEPHISETEVRDRDPVTIPLRFEHFSGGRARSLSFFEPVELREGHREKCNGFGMLIPHGGFRESCNGAFSERDSVCRL